MRFWEHPISYNNRYMPYTLTCFTTKIAKNIPFLSFWNRISCRYDISAVVAGLRICFAALAILVLCVFWQWLRQTGKDCRSATILVLCVFWQYLPVHWLCFSGYTTLGLPDFCNSRRVGVAILRYLQFSFFMIFGSTGPPADRKFRNPIYRENRRLIKAAPSPYQDCTISAPSPLHDFAVFAAKTQLVFTINLRNPMFLSPP